MQGITNSTLTAEVEKKLDDLFQEDAEEQEKREEGEGQDLVIENDSETIPSAQEAQEESKQEESPLGSLKSIVLSLEWEITDEAMRDFLSQTEAIRDKCGEDHALKTFVQMLLALGKYIKRHKADSNPEAVRLLNTTFQSFEKSFEGEITEEEKKDLVDQRVREFMDLKRAIGAKSRASHQEIKGSMLNVDQIKEAVGEAVREAMNDIMQAMKEEFQSLRAELRAWHKEG